MSLNQEFMMKMYWLYPEMDNMKIILFAWLFFLIYDFKKLIFIILEYVVYYIFLTFKIHFCKSLTMRKYEIPTFVY